MREADRIEGERVYLRPAADEDTKRLVRWRNLPHVSDNFIRKEPLTREIHEHWRATEIASGRAVQFIIVRKADDVPIGSQYYMQIDRETKSAEFGIYIGEVSALGQGYGEEAARLAIAYAARALGLKEILLRVREQNRRAAALYKRLGFTILPERTVTEGEGSEAFRVIFMKKELS